MIPFRLTVQDSYDFDLSSFTSDEKTLFERFPKPYKDFIANSNGGIVEARCSNFKTNIEWSHSGKRNTEQTSEIEVLFGFISYENAESTKIPSVLHEHYDRHLGEEFLPDDVFVIASCTQNCLIAISLNQHDYGQIYFWDWYWRYPWYQEFFDRRVETARNMFDDVDAIMDNREHKLWTEAFNALNYASIVKVADGFDEFVQNLFEEQ